MPKQVPLRRAGTGAHAVFTGAQGEVTVDTDKKVVVVHDGSTPGGHPSMKDADGVKKANNLSDVTRETARENLLQANAKLGERRYDVKAALVDPSESLWTFQVRRQLPVLAGTGEALDWGNLAAATSDEGWGDFGGGGFAGRLERLEVRSSKWPRGGPGGGKRGRFFDRMNKDGQDLEKG